MQTTLSHLQINIRPENVQFYRDLMAFLGWAELFVDERMVGVGHSSGTSLWFAGYANDAANDYDGVGMNHVSFGTATQAEVDDTVAYLKERGIPALFETPRHRPEFSENEASTYYQVMFESPDKVLFEVVYIGPKNA